VLREGENIQVLYERAVLDDVDWLHVRDEAGRIGWVAAQFVELQP
jgi:hypothetical protein